MAIRSEKQPFRSLFRNFSNNLIGGFKVRGCGKILFPARKELRYREKFLRVPLNWLTGISLNPHTVRLDCPFDIYGPYDQIKTPGNKDWKKHDLFFHSLVSMFTFCIWLFTFFILVRYLKHEGKIESSNPRRKVTTCLWPLCWSKKTSDMVVNLSSIFIQIYIMFIDISQNESCRILKFMSKL